MADEPELKTYILAVSEGDHGHWGRGRTKEEALENLHECGCNVTVEFWEVTGPDHDVPHIKDNGMMRSWSEPKLLEQREMNQHARG